MEADLPEDVDIGVDIEEEEEEEEEEGIDGFMPTEQVDEQTQTLAAGLASRDSDELTQALQEMLRVLALPPGGKVLRQYVLASPRCAELLAAWEAGPGAPTAVPLMLLLSEIFRHPVGKGDVSIGAGRKHTLGGSNDAARTKAKAMVVVQARLDKLARSIARTKMKDVYSHLSSTQRSRQKAGLKLMSSIVLRGKPIAVEVATNFDFTLEALKKLAQHPYKAPVFSSSTQGLLHHSTRFFFIEFALSFLVVGDPGLLRWILQKRPLYAGVLHGLAKDEESIINQVLKVLQEKVMAPASLVPAGLQSAVFGDVALEQLARIAGDELFGESADLAYETLMSLCTDPSHGLCPEVSSPWEVVNAKTGAHGGNQGRLLRLMLRLRVTEASRHRELLLATAKARPKLAAAYLDSVPYSLEPRPSPTWFSAISLVADLIHISSIPPPFSLMALRGLPTPVSDGPLIRSNLRHLLPRALTKVALNRGLQHANVLVKHACLRVLLEALLSLELLLDAAFGAAETLSAQEMGGHPIDSSGFSCRDQDSRMDIPGYRGKTDNGSTGVAQERSISMDDASWGEEQESNRLQWLSLVESIQDTMRATLPDPNILLIIHSTLHTGNGQLKHPHERRKRTQIVGEVRPGKRRKKDEGYVNEEGDELNANDSDISSDSEGGDEQDNGEAETLGQIWGVEAVVSAEGYTQSLLQAKVLEVLAAFQRVLPVAFADKGFDPFKLLPSDPMQLSLAQQEAFMSLLLATTGGPRNGYQKSKTASRHADTAGSGLMYKHVKSLLNVMVSSDVGKVRDDAHLLSSRIMISTGAFDSNSWEASVWLDHLLRLEGKVAISDCDPHDTCGEHSSRQILGSIGDCVVNFLSEAVGTVGRTLYKHLDQLFSLLSANSLGEGHTDLSDKSSGLISPEFGPFAVCALEHSLRVVRSDSKSLSLPQRSAISIYVAGVLNHLLQIQTDARALGVVITTLLSPDFDSITGDHTKDSKTTDSAWIPLQILYRQARSVLNYGDYFSTSLTTIAKAAEHSGQLRDVLTACKEVSEDNLVEQRDKLVSTLVCAPTHEVSKNFLLLVEVFSKIFEGNIPILITLCGVHRSLLMEVDSISENVRKSKDRAAARGLTVSGLLTRFSTESSSTLDLLPTSSDVPASSTRQVSAMYRFLRSLPFSVLFPAAVMYTVEGKIFTLEVLSAALRTSYSSILFRERPVVMRMILSYIQRLAFVSLTSSDKCALLDTCFTFLKRLVVPPQDWNIGGEDNEGIEEILVYKLLVAESLAHPALAEFCLCPTAKEGSSLKGEKSGRLLDGYILEFLKSLLDLCSSLDLHGKSNKVAQLLGSLQETTFLTGKAYFQQATALFSLKFNGRVCDENEETFSKDFMLVRSFVTKLAPYAEPQEFLNFISGLLSRKGVQTPSGVRLSSICLDLARVFFVSCVWARPKVRVGDKAESMGPVRQESLVDVFRYVVKEALKDSTEEKGDVCLLSALQSPISSLPGTRFLSFSISGQFSHLVSITPIEVIKYCVQHPTAVRGKIARTLVQASAIHRSAFGHLLANGTKEGKVEDDELPRLNMASKFLQQKAYFQEGNNNASNLSEDQLLLLLPAAGEFLAKSVSRPVMKVMTHVASVYLRLLTKLFKSWDEYVEKYVKLTEADSNFLELLEEKITVDEFVRSLCGGCVTVFKQCLHICPLSIKKCVSLLRKFLPKNGLPLADLHRDFSQGSEVDFRLRLLKVFGKAAMARQILLNIQALGPDKNHEETDKEDDITPVSEKRKGRSPVSDIMVRFAANLVATLASLYKPTTQMQTEVTTLSVPATTSKVATLLEEYLQAQLVAVVEVLDVTGFVPETVPLFQNFAKTCLRFKFGKVGGMEVLQALAMHLTHVSQEHVVLVRDAAASVLELVLAHSQFVPLLCSSSTSTKTLPLNLGRHAGKGTVLISLPSILSLIGSPVVSPLEQTSSIISENEVTNTEGSKNTVVDDGDDNAQDKFSEESKLVLVKLVRSLFQLKMHPDGDTLSAEDLTMLEDLLSLLLAAYGATIDKVDLEMLALMRELELYGGKGFRGLAGMDFLWGEAAIKRRRARAEEEKSQSVDEDMESEDNMLEARKRSFREDLAIDPRRCGLSVLYFPSTTQPWKSSAMPFGNENVGDKLMKGSQGEVYDAEEQRLRVAAYDPGYFLPFALHGLSEGCIDAEEYVRLGMLAVAMASLSSPDEGVRKLGYEILAKYLAVLEAGPSFKGQPQIRLLLTYVKNAITEPWQQLPFVLMLFAAEASCILMHPESIHYLTITRYLLRGPGMDLEYVPLFHSMFGSGSPRYRSERLWMMRLLAFGLTSSQDSRVYRRQFVLEILMSFYNSPLADTFTRKWVLQVLRKAARIRPCIQALVERAGFLPWLASAAVNARDSNTSEQDGKEASDLAVMVLEVIENVVRWRFMEQRGLGEGMEELTTVALGLHQFMTHSAATPKQRAVFRRPTLRIMTSILRLSQRRKKHQTHFSLSLRGVLDAIRWVESEGPDCGFGSETTQETRALALQMLLQSSPPAASTHKDKLLLCQVASWAVPVAIQVLTTPKHTQSQVGRLAETNRVTESTPEKLLRWLAASLVLGKIASDTNKQTPAYHPLADTPATCWSVVVGSYATHRKDFHPVYGTLAIHLMELQRHTVGEGALISIVTSLAALWPFSRGFCVTEVELQVDEPAQRAKALVESLLSNIPAPQETDVLWRWSFNNAWQSKQTLGISTRTSEKSAMEAPLCQTEICQVTLTVFQQLLLGDTPAELTHLLSQWAIGLADDTSADCRPLCSHNFLERLNCAILVLRSSAAAGLLL